MTEALLKEDVSVEANHEPSGGGLSAAADDQAGKIGSESVAGTPADPETKQDVNPQGDSGAKPEEKPKSVLPPSPKKPLSPADRRTAERHPVKWRAALEMGKQVVYGHTIDVSSSGAGILVTMNVVPHQSVRLHLQLPPAHYGAEQSVITLDGRIAYATLSGRHDGFLIGVEFGKSAMQGIAKLARHFRPGFLSAQRIPA